MKFFASDDDIFALGDDNFALGNKNFLHQATKFFLSGEGASLAVYPVYFFDFHHFGGGDGGGGGGGSGGGGSGVGGGRGISWDALLLTDSSIFVFIEKALRTDLRTDRRTDPLIEMRGRI